jgi:hypothetical protein
MAKSSAAPVTLSPTQRQRALQAAPSEPGDHVIQVDGGPCAVVRRDHHGVRVVAVGHDPATALRRAVLPRDPAALAEVIRQRLITAGVRGRLAFRGA